jgi:hypothetical protein
MISIHTLKNQIEAQVIEGELKAAGIKCVIRPFNDSAYDGIFMAQKGYGQVLVDDKDKQRAEEILNETLK